MTRRRAGPGFACGRAGQLWLPWLSQRLCGGGVGGRGGAGVGGGGWGREGPTHRKTRGKRVRLAALVWAVGWGQAG